VKKSYRKLTDATEGSATATSKKTVQTESYRPIKLRSQEIWVAESNVVFRVSAESSKTAVSAHGQYNQSKLKVVDRYISIRYMKL